MVEERKSNPSPSGLTVPKSYHHPNSFATLIDETNTDHLYLKQKLSSSFSKDFLGSNSEVGDEFKKLKNSSFKSRWEVTNKLLLIK